jgi:hypothetical protein
MAIIGVIKWFSRLQIIGEFRAAEILMSKGSSIADICKKIGVIDVTFSGLRKLYGEMQVFEAKRLRE